MSEKKKKSKATIIVLIIVAVIALGVFAYIKYLDGAFNTLLSKSEATKDLVVVDLDTEKRKQEIDEEKYEEYTLDNGVEAEYFLDDSGEVEVVQMQAEVAADKVDSATLTAAATACKALKGIKFEYEEVDGKLKLDITVAPEDVSDELFDKAVDLNILSQEQADKYKNLLDGASVEEINKLLQEIKY